MKNDFFTRLTATTFWAAPLLMLCFDAYSLTGNEQYFIPASVLFWFSFFAFIGLAHALVQLAGRSSLSYIAGLIAAFGCLIGITIIGMARYEWGLEMEGVDSDTLKAAHGNPWVFFTSRMPGITFPVGFILLSIAVYKKQKFHWSLLAALILSLVLFPMGRISGEVGFNVAGDLLMLLSFGYLGRRSSRTLLPPTIR